MPNQQTSIKAARVDALKPLLKGPLKVRYSEHTKSGDCYAWIADESGFEIAINHRLADHIAEELVAGFNAGLGVR